MEEKYVSYVVTWNDISSHKVTAIYSGVGSGKNKFVEKITTECIAGQTKPQKVLLITSRKAKVSETLEELDDVFASYIGLNGNVKLDKYQWWNYSYGFGELPEDLIQYEVDSKIKILNKSAICTNAKIEAFLKKVFKNNKDFSLFWEWFDIIVIDEVHSLLMDAGYQSAPFHIFNLIKEFNNRCADESKHMILMTGTPQPVDEILHKICDDINVIDLFDKCKNAVPKGIRFIDAGSLKKDIQNKILSGSKIIYFYNGTPLTSKEFCNDTEIKESIVATTFTDPEKRDKYKDSDASGFGRMAFTEEFLTEKKKLPESIQLLLTTSRLKEGINIIDDIDYVYIDSHLPADVIQMSGRVRNGNHTVYLVIDAYQFDDERDILDNKSFIIEDREEVEDLNKGLSLITETDDKLSYVEEITAEYIDDGNEKKLNPQCRHYIQFNYFAGRFEFYELKEWYLEYKLENINKWNAVNPDKPNGYKRLVKNWFPDCVEISSYESKIYKSQRLFKDQYRFKIDSDDPKDRYSKDRISKFLEELKLIWDIEYKNVGTYLRQFMPDVQIKTCGKSKDKYRFVTKTDKKI